MPIQHSEKSTAECHHSGSLPSALAPQYLCFAQFRSWFWELFMDFCACGWYTFWFFCTVHRSIGYDASSLDDGVAISSLLNGQFRFWESQHWWRIAEQLASMPRRKPPAAPHAAGSSPPLQVPPFPRLQTDQFVNNNYFTTVSWWQLDANLGRREPLGNWWKTNKRRLIARSKAVAYVTLPLPGGNLSASRAARF